MSAFLSIRVIDICDECGGSGNDRDQVCIVCRGEGVIDIVDAIPADDIIASQSGESCQ